eukprot:COSAG06_NODE_1333_length_9835_cov_20.745994_2_plen_179_part_00
MPLLDLLNSEGQKRIDTCRTEGPSEEIHRTSPALVCLLRPHALVSAPPFWLRACARQGPRESPGTTMRRRETSRVRRKQNAPPAKSLKRRKITRGAELRGDAEQTDARVPEPQAVLARRRRGVSFEYKIRWSNQSTTKATWCVFAAPPPPTSTHRWHRPATPPPSTQHTFGTRSMPSG